MFGSAGVSEGDHVSRTWKIVIGVGVLVVLFIAATVITIQIRGAGPQIDTATVERVDLSVTVTASGKVEAGRRADVYPPTQGTISDVFVKDGQHVKAGQKLAQMDTGPLLLAVDQAKAGIAAAKGQLEAVQNQEPANADIVAAQANVNAAQAAYNAAKVQVAGASAPASQQIKAANATVQAAGVAKHNAYLAWQAAKHAVETSAHPTPAAILAEQQAETGYYQANAAYESAKASKKALVDNNLPVAQAQACAAKKQAFAALKTAEASLAKLQRAEFEQQENAAIAAQRQAEAALAVAQQQLNDATMVAPIDGTVFFNALGLATPAGSGTQKAAPGAGVSPASPVFTVIDLSGTTFVAEVDEADIAKVKAGQPASILFDAFPSQPIKTKVTRVQPAARTTATGGTVFPVDLSLTNVPVQILIGMKGDATIKVKALPTAIVIPIEALFDENGKTFVYVVENNRLKKTDITVGAQTDTQVQVTQGLQPGQVVALSGATQFTDGMAVRVKK